MKDLERYRAATVRPWIRIACKLAVGFGAFAVLVFLIGLLFEDAAYVGWSFGGEYGWSYRGSPKHPLAVLSIFEMVLWALAGLAILKGKRWALDLLFALLAFQSLDWFVAFVLGILNTLPRPVYQVEFVFPLIVLAIASGQWKEWRSPRYFETPNEE